MPGGCQATQRLLQFAVNNRTCMLGQVTGPQVCNNYQQNICHLGTYQIVHTITATQSCLKTYYILFPCMSGWVLHLPVTTHHVPPVLSCTYHSYALWPDQGLSVCTQWYTSHLLQTLPDSSHTLWWLRAVQHSLRGCVSDICSAEVCSRHCP